MESMLHSFSTAPGNGRRTRKGKQGNQELTEHERQMIERFLSKLPKDQQQWEDRPLFSHETLHQRLVLSEFAPEERASMRWETLIETLAGKGGEFRDGDWWQLYQLVLLSAYRVAEKAGVYRANEDNLPQALLRAIPNEERTIRDKLHALSKCLQILEFIEEYVGPCAWQVLWRVKLLSKCQTISWEAIKYLRLECESIYKPCNREYSNSLKVPDLVYTLYGGGVSLLQIKRWLEIDNDEVGGLHLKYTFLPGIHGQLQQTAVADVMILLPARLLDTFYSYDALDSCIDLGNAFLNDWGNDIQSFACRNGKEVVIPRDVRDISRGYRMNASGAFWAKEDEIAVVIPLFHGSYDIELISHREHSHRFTWRAGFAIVYCGLGLHVRENYVRFFLCLIKTNGAA